ncbi:MAG: hypothetical protein JWQ02_1296 [Capsulimonas sp.]|nr:hypothetical protein [Capsulimonas sp.]
MFPTIGSSNYNISIKLLNEDICNSCLKGILSS